MAFDGGQWVISATATNITNALSLTGGDLPSGGRHFKMFRIGNKVGATQPLYVGKSNVTNVPANALIEIPIGTSVDLGSAAWSGPLNTDEVFLGGTANALNIAFIALVV